LLSWRRIILLISPDEKSAFGIASKGTYARDWNCANQSCYEIIAINIKSCIDWICTRIWQKSTDELYRNTASLKQSNSLLTRTDKRTAFVLLKQYLSTRSTIRYQIVSDASNQLINKLWEKAQYYIVRKRRRIKQLNRESSVKSTVPSKRQGKRW